MGDPAETPVTDVDAAAGAVSEALEVVADEEAAVSVGAAVVVVVVAELAESVLAAGAAVVVEAAGGVVMLELETLAADAAESVATAVLEVAVLEALSVLKTTVRLPAPSVEEAATVVVVAELVVDAEAVLEATLLEAESVLEEEPAAAAASTAPPNPLTIDAITWEASTPAGREYTLVETTMNELAVPVALAADVIVELAESVFVGLSGSLMMSVGRWGALALAPASLNEEEAGESGSSMMSVILAVGAADVEEASAEEVAVDASVEVLLDESSEDDVGVASPSVGLESSEPSVGLASSVGSAPSVASPPSAGSESDPSAGFEPSEESESSPEPSLVVCLVRTNEGSRAKTTLRLCTFTLATGIDIAN